MSLDFYLKNSNDDTLFSRNITHNLGKMATEANIYKVLWHPETANCFEAKDCIPILEKGLLELLRNKEKYEQFNASNGWGTYKNFVPFVVAVLTACHEYPDATVYTST